MGRRPAQRLSIGVIFTALSLRLIRWKRRGSGTASRLRARRRQSEHKEQRETSRRRIFVTRDQTEGSHYRVGEPALSTQETCRLGSLRDGSDNTGYVLAERKIHFYSRHVCPVDARCFGQPALALRVFRRHQMASRGTRSQDLSTGSNLEAFRHCFSRFATCN